MKFQNGFKVFSSLIVTLLLVSVAMAQDKVTKPHTFSAGTPASAEDVNENFDVLYDEIAELKSASGGNAPMKFELYNRNITTWVCEDKNLENYCGDEDGCTIRLLLQHETDVYDQVHVIDELIYMESPSLSSNNGDGIYGYTRQIGGGDFSWITGMSNRYTIFSPWEWVYAFNYRHRYCSDQTEDGAPHTDPYLFTFMSHPNVRATVIVYDR